MASPWVERNLDGAQYAQPRGSQYEGPNYFYLDGEREYHDRALNEWRENALPLPDYDQSGCIAHGRAPDEMDHDGQCPECKAVAA